MAERDWVGNARLLLTSLRCVIATKQSMKSYRYEQGPLINDIQTQLQHNLILNILMCFRVYDVNDKLFIKLTGLAYKCRVFSCLCVLDASTNAVVPQTANVTLDPVACSWMTTLQFLT